MLKDKNSKMVSKTINYAYKLKDANATLKT